MTTEIRITADERLLAALSAIAGALNASGAHPAVPEPAAAPAAAEQPTPEPAQAPAPAAPAAPTVDEAALRKEIKQLGITAVRAKKTEAVKALLAARDLTELKDIPVDDLEAFKAEMEACLA